MAGYLSFPHIWLGGVGVKPPPIAGYRSFCAIWMGGVSAFPKQSAPVLQPSTWWGPMEMDNTVGGYRSMMGLHLGGVSAEE